MLPLPIDALLPGILASLRRTPNLVLEAAPGAGKTTRVPPALLDLVKGQIIVLEPRRIAVRLAARRVAEELGEPVGEIVGYQVRFENVSGPRTRLSFVTEGILTRRLLSNPTLQGVDAVILDEFHERHLETDLALALLKRLQRSRPQLHLIVMSATLQTGPVADFLNAPTLRSEGRAFPLTIRHLPYGTDIAQAAAQLIAEGHRGHTLAFLPGTAEIYRAARACEPLARTHGLLVLPLHGGLAPAEQDRVLAPSTQPKLILATNVAESSVTVPGVTAVIDTGLHRHSTWSPWTGLPTLTVARISQASATQRAGRAGRTAPGQVLRLYPQQDLEQRPQHDTPEILRADLTQLALTLRVLNTTHPGAPGLAPETWEESPQPSTQSTTHPGAPGLAPETWEESPQPSTQSTTHPGAPGLAPETWEESPQPSTEAPTHPGAPGLAPETWEESPQPSTEAPTHPGAPGLAPETWEESPQPSTQSTTHPGAPGLAPETWEESPQPSTQSTTHPGAPGLAPETWEESPQPSTQSTTHPGAPGLAPETWEESPQPSTQSTTHPGAPGLAPETWELSPQPSTQSTTQAPMMSPAQRRASWEQSLTPADWLTPPPPAALAAAEAFLDSLAPTIEQAARLTRYPLPPRLARLLIAAQDAGLGESGCQAAALLSSTAPTSGDLLTQLDATPDPATAQTLKQLLRLARPPRQTVYADDTLLKALLTAYPDRVARLRAGREVLLSNGITAELAADPPSYGLLLALDAEDRTDKPLPLIRTWCRCEPDWLLDLFPERLTEATTLVWNRTAERIEAVSTLRYDQLVLEESRTHNPEPEAAAQLLAEKALEAGLPRFIDPAALENLEARFAFAGLPAPDVPGTLRQLAQGLRSFAELEAAARNLLPLLEQSAPRLHELAPTTLKLPSGRTTRVHYEQDKPPWIASRLQDFFGMAETPRIGPAREPVVVHLLAPNQRAVQTTTDLAGFWQRLYPQVRKELMRRYPRHQWPEKP